MVLKCPADQQALTISDSEGHLGYRCSTCGGTWLPASYVTSIAQEHDFDPKAFVASLAASTDRDSSKACPDDGNILAMAQVEGIELDWCRECNGVWFDTGEIARLLAQHPCRELSTADHFAIHFLSSLPW